MKSESVACCLRRPAYGAFAEKHGLLHISMVASLGQHVYEASISRT